MATKLILISLCLFGIAQSSHRSEQRDRRLVKVEIDGKEYNLNLKRSLRQVVEDDVPIFTLKRVQRARIVTAIDYKNRRINGAIYNDDKNMATMVVREDKNEGRVFYNGVISPGSIARPVKFSRPLQDDLQPRTDFIPAPESNNVLLKKPLTTLYPKIIVVVEYPLYKKLGGDINKVFKYVSIFFNAVDLRFSKLTSIDVKISVTGLAIVTDKNIKKLERAKEFFTRRFSEKTGFVDYDAAFVLTTTDVKALTGKIHLGSICNKLHSTIFEKDDGAFSGLTHTIHDLAHLLNVGHDGVGDSVQCNSDDTVMAETKQRNESLRWSECSNKIIKAFAKTVPAACLARGYRYPSIL